MIPCLSNIQQVNCGVTPYSLNKVILKEYFILKFDIWNFRLSIFQTLLNLLSFDSNELIKRL